MLISAYSSINTYRDVEEIYKILIIMKSYVQFFDSINH